MNISAGLRSRLDPDLILGLDSDPYKSEYEAATVCEGENRFCYIICTGSLFFCYTPFLYCYNTFTNMHPPTHSFTLFLYAGIFVLRLCAELRGSEGPRGPNLQYALGSPINAPPIPRPPSPPPNHQHYALPCHPYDLYDFTLCTTYSTV